MGIGGGVPHYTDYRQHVRLGDVVVSTSPKKAVPPPASPRATTNGHANGGGTHPGFPSTVPQANRSDYVYVHCEKLRSSPDEPLNASNSAVAKLNTVDSFNYRFWCPYSLELQTIAKQLVAEARQTGARPWEQYLVEARQALMALGYAGWGEGQLEDELAENVWLTAEADLDLIFDADHETKWTRALAQLGVDAAMLSSQGGRA